MLSICFMTLLGFVDDAVDLPWRYKLVLPTIASVPLLMAYNGVTNVVVPIPLRGVLGDLVDLGYLYHVYMSMIAIFCTNSINIYAGINGIEVAQSLVIGCSMVLHNVIELGFVRRQDTMHNHIFSLSVMLPFVFVCLPLLRFNKFPSRVFIGDTFCNFAGMAFAVAGILGHCSKTLMLFFIPQMLNFFLSIP